MEVVNATDVPVARFEIGGSDPYVCMEVDEEVKKTKVVNRSKDPVFKEMFRFDLDGAQKSLNLVLFDHDVGTEDDLLGAYPVPLSDFADQKEHKESYPMIVAAYKPKKCAVVHCKIRYITKERLCTIKIQGLDEKTDEVSLKDSFGPYGEIRRVLMFTEPSGPVAWIEMGDEAARDKAVKHTGAVDGQDVKVENSPRSVREMKDLIAAKEAKEAAIEKARLEAEEILEDERIRAMEKKQEEERVAMELKMAQERKEIEEKLAADKEEMEKQLAEQKTRAEEAAAKNKAEQDKRLAEEKAQRAILAAKLKAQQERQAKAEQQQREYAAQQARQEKERQDKWKPKKLGNKLLRKGVKLGRRWKK